MNDLGRDPSLLVLSNPSGVAEYTNIEDGKTYKVNYGLGGIPGGPDLIVLIHWRVAAIRGCQIVGIEVKRPGEQPRENQETWRRNAARWGMRIGAAHDVSEARALIDLSKSELRKVGLEISPAGPTAIRIPG